MSETLITGQTSEDLLADFETLLNSGSIDLGEDHQIVIFTSPSNEGLHPAVAPTSTGEILLFATPQGPADVGLQDKRPALGRPPVRRGGRERQSLEKVTVIRKLLSLAVCWNVYKAVLSNIVCLKPIHLLLWNKLACHWAGVSLSLLSS